jgi:hypothetical protein
MSYLYRMSTYKLRPTRPTAPHPDRKGAPRPGRKLTERRSRSTSASRNYIRSRSTSSSRDNTRSRIPKLRSETASKIVTEARREARLYPSETRTNKQVIEEMELNIVKGVEQEVKDRLLAKINRLNKKQKDAHRFTKPQLNTYLDELNKTSNECFELFRPIFGRDNQEEYACSLREIIQYVEALIQEKQQRHVSFANDSSRDNSSRRGRLRRSATVRKSPG